jgi:FHS family L-fucose permease-like MFS transporter
MKSPIRSVPPLAIIGMLFFVFGFVTWLGSVLIPYLRIACELNAFQSYFVAFAFYISYTLMALPASRVLKWSGLKKGMTVGLLTMALGTLVFIPAAQVRQFPVFLIGLFIQGAGLTVLQAAANPYVTILGPSESAAKRISFMGICNGTAGMLAPIILGSVILKNADGFQSSLAKLNAAEKVQALDALASRVVTPYAIMAACLALLAAFVHFSGLPEPDKELDEEQDGVKSGKTGIWQFPHLLLGVVALFMYVGVEVIAGDTIAGYATSQGIPLSRATFFASFTLLNMLIGYGIGILCIPRFITQDKALKVTALAGIFFATMALLTHGVVSVCFVAGFGLANALIWPSVWPLAIDGLGRFTKTGSSLLIMAVGGGALLPLLYGYLSDHIGPHNAYLMVIPCYLTIFLYAWKLHKIRV